MQLLLMENSRDLRSESDLSEILRQQIPGEVRLQLGMESISLVFDYSARVTYVFQTSRVSLPHRFLGGNSIP